MRFILVLKELSLICHSLIFLPLLIIWHVFLIAIWKIFLLFKGISLGLKFHQTKVALNKYILGIYKLELYVTTLQDYHVYLTFLKSYLLIPLCYDSGVIQFLLSSFQLLLLSQIKRIILFLRGKFKVSFNNI